MWSRTLDALTINKKKIKLMPQYATEADDRSTDDRWATSRLYPLKTNYWFDYQEP